MSLCLQLYGMSFIESFLLFPDGPAKNNNSFKMSDLPIGQPSCSFVDIMVKELLQRAHS